MAHNEKLDICNKALLRAAGVENPEPQYAEVNGSTPLPHSQMTPQTFLVSGEMYAPISENNINAASAIEFLTATWKTELQNTRTQLKEIADDVSKLGGRIARASDYLRGLIDGDSPMDSEISTVIRILDGTQP